MLHAAPPLPLLPTAPPFAPPPAPLQAVRLEELTAGLEGRGLLDDVDLDLDLGDDDDVEDADLAGGCPLSWRHRGAAT